MVHYRDISESGGSLRVGETIANHLDPDRVAARMVFAYGGPGPVAKQTRVPCHFIKARGPRDPLGWLRARLLFRELRPDIIHFQDGVVWLRAALLGSAYTKKIVHVHGRYEKTSRNKGPNSSHPFRASRLLRTYLKLTDAQVCISDGARKSLLDLGWISSERSHVVYNAVDVSRFKSAVTKSEARASLDLPPDVKLLGIVCRLVKEKGCADLLSIIAKLPSRWHGVICGTGPQRRQLEQQCAARNLSGRIHFLGSQDDVTNVYAALDAYAFLSSYEPFGLVVAEAMAYGVPVFGVMSDGEYAEPQYPLIRPDNAVMIQGDRTSEKSLSTSTIDELARHLEHFADQAESYRALIERARLWVTNCFGAPLQAEAMTRVYESICGGVSAGEVSLSDWYEGKRRLAELLIATNEDADAAVA
jgi:glycosyltransferase involved in cell wall biosynthesis